MSESIDMTAFIVAKSDQLNADDLAGGPRTILITGVKANTDSAEQPISIYFEGDNNKPLKPCKTVRRIMVAVWGPQASEYIGRSMTIYRDPKVVFGGMQVGGIRISHMSHMEREMVVAANATRGKKAAHKILPLKVEQTRKQPNPDAAEKWAREHIESVFGADDTAALDAVIASGAKAMAKLQGANAELHGRVAEAYAKRREEVADADTVPFGDDDGFPGDE